MPEAGVKTAAQKYELNSCSGGYVELRQLSYDEILERRDGAMQVLQQMGVKNANAQIRFANKWSQQFAFSRCIVDHNLTFDGKPIDFTKGSRALAQLDPKIGYEIEKLIDAMNEEPEDEEVFTTPPSSSSLDGETTQSSSLEKNS